MIGLVIDALTLSEPHRFIFVGQSSHEAAYGLTDLLRIKAPGCEVVLIDSLPHGPAATALLAEPWIDNGDELLVAYCDGFVTVDLSDFLTACRHRLATGGLMTYPSTDPADSYALVDKTGSVLRTAEKQLISPEATVGLYYFSSGCGFAAATRRMIALTPPGAGEYFICPIFNELIADGLPVFAYRIESSQCVEMGTPADLAQTRDRMRGDERQREFA